MNQAKDNIYKMLEIIYFKNQSWWFATRVFILKN